VLSFNTAMMTQVNEVEKDKHLKAVFIEFLEGFGRACEKISMPTPYEEGDEDYHVMTEKERHDQLLWRKILNVLPTIYKNLLPKAFQDKWSWPKVDPKTGLFKDKYFKKKLKTIQKKRGADDTMEDEEVPIVYSIFE